MASSLSGGTKRPSSPLTDEHSAKRSTLQTTLETVPDDIDDAKHALLDEAVFTTCREPIDSILAAAFLVITIVSNSEGRLDPKYSNSKDARALVEGHELLQKNLKQAWDNGTFKYIRNLKILRPSQTFHTALGVPIEQRDAVISAWKQEYQGTAYKVLLKAVDEVHAMPRDRQYAKIVPVVQSSGTGKSKTIDKIATERILFPICLREDLPQQYFAYPHPDTAVRDHLLRAPSAKQERECKAYLRSFLCSLFISACGKVQGFFSPSARVPYTSIAKQFYDFFGNKSSRDDFYESVIFDIDPQKNSLSDVTKSFNMFKDSAKASCSNWPDDICPILVSMDEVHVLFNPRVQDTGSAYDLFSRLRSVLSEAVSEAVCFIFLSTVTNASKIAHSEEVAPSMRERDDEYFLPAPVTELPFDVYLVSEPLVSGTAMLTSVGSLEFTAKFGRPLFYATYLSRKDQNEPLTKSVPGIMLTAREKLSGRRWPPTSSACLDVSSIAVLSARFLLDLSTTASSSRQYEEQLVRSHLRMLYSVRQYRQVMVTGSSPEPLIAEAAAQIMNTFIVRNGDKKKYMDTWDLLVKFIDEGLAPQGTIGELIGRVLSILAMDRAIHALSEHRELEYQTPVTVTAYYEAFLTKDAWEKLRHSIPANSAKLSGASAMKTFEAAFAKAYFHFSHYGKANDVTPMQDRLAWALWLRGTAILCQFNHYHAIPIYFPNSGNVSPKSVSIALEQDETGQSAEPDIIGIQSAETLGLFSQGNKPPYIVAIHCYALRSNEGISVSTPSENLHDLRHPDKDIEAPRYQIDFRGLAAYRVVTMSMKADIRTMIDGSRDALFKNHSRKYGEASLRQMLPVLSGHENATRWLRGEDVSSSLGDDEDTLMQFTGRLVRQAHGARSKQVTLNLPLVPKKSKKFKTTGRKKQVRL